MEEEFELSQALPRLLYVKEPAPDRDPRLAALLARIRQGASYRRFRTPAELGRLVRDDLATLLSERFTAARSAVADPMAATRENPMAVTARGGSAPRAPRLVDGLTGACLGSPAPQIGRAHV